MRRWHSIHIHILHKMHKQYATEEIEKKEHATMTCCFFQRKISNKQQKLIPKDLIRIFQISRCAGIKVFFRPSISPKLVPRRHAIFFSADESGTNRPSGKTFLQGVIWRRKWHCGNTAWLFTLERRFFTHIEREQQKNARHTRFFVGCLVDIGSEKFPQ